MFSVQADIRVTLQWDTDLNDLELHVTEPNDQICHVFHNKTKNGGLLSRDFSNGYGPEEYVLRDAVPGSYSVFSKLAFATNKVQPQQTGFWNSSLAFCFQIQNWDVQKIGLLTWIRPMATLLW